MADQSQTTRRAFCQRVAGFIAGAACLPRMARSESMQTDPKYILASCMYGCLDLEVIVPEAPKIGAEHIDIWPKVHGNQREQMAEMGLEAFQELLKENGVQLGILTHYDLGPFGLQEEMKVAQTLGGSMVICGGAGPKDLEGSELKEAVREFAEKMKPHMDAAGEAGLVIGIENHANNLIDSPDSMKWLAEFSSEEMGLAMAPYHLPQDESLLVKLIRDLGQRLVHFYAWQHGVGCHEKRPKEEELLQMPGRGELDFVPLMAALEEIRYDGWIEVFMHPVPRGIPILPTAEEVSAEINRARAYLEECMGKG